MRHFMKSERGFTLIELLIVVVIIGILAAVGVPIYSRYITSARASEAPTQVMALREYAQSYLRAHPTLLFDTGSLLNAAAEACSPNNSTGNTCATTNTNDWVDQVVGTDNAYFNYYWTGGATRQIQAQAVAGLCTGCEGDKMIFEFDSNGGGGTWSVTPADSRLNDVLPN